MSSPPITFDESSIARQRVAIVGAGPAGLMAAEQLAQQGVAVDVFDAMPSAGRKFLMAGRGGMNLTHSEPYADFLTRYEAQRERLTPAIDDFSPDALREWVHALGIDTFIGSSGRVFPTDMKAAPMLRAWLHRLREAGVRFHMRHKWVGWEGGGQAGDGGHHDGITLRFMTAAPSGTGKVAKSDASDDSDTPGTSDRSALSDTSASSDRAAPSDTSATSNTSAASTTSSTSLCAAAVSTVAYKCDAVVLALGGASWPRLGSDAAWVPLLRDKQVAIVDFEPANCGFDVDWTPFFVSRFAGQALKNVALSVEDPTTRATPHAAGAGAGAGADDSAESLGAVASVRFRHGECMLTENGIEGGLIYALSATIRQLIHRDGVAAIHLDLLPGHSAQRVTEAVMHPRGKRSLSSHLSSTLGLTGAKAALLYECLSKDIIADPVRLAAAIKALPLRVRRPRPIAEAISSAGGVSFDALDAHLMIRTLPGLFCAGEMIDWEAPTGGYLLTACLATGRQAGQGVYAYLQHITPAPSATTT